MKVNFDITLSKSQQEMYDLVHDDAYKFYTFIASRQQGKSVLMQVLVIEWLLGKNNAIAYTCKNFVLAKKLYRELIRILPKALIKTSNGSDLFIESVTGSTLMFASAVQGSSLRGQTFTHLICDEFAFFKQQQPDGTHLWNDILSPTLKARGKKCVFITTPLGKQNLAYEMYMRGLSDDYPKYCSLLKTIYNDGFVTEEEIEEIRKSIPELSFRCEYMCEFIDGALTVFPGFDRLFTNSSEIPTDSQVWMGLDLSTVGEDRTVLSVIDRSGNMEQHVIEGSLDSKYSQIGRLIDTYPRLQVIYIETNGVGMPMLNEIRKNTRQKSKIVEFVTTNSSKREIIGLMQQMIANGQVRFHKDNQLLYSEFATFMYSVSKAGNVIYGAKEGYHDDTVMSACMAASAKDRYKAMDTRRDVTFVGPKLKSIG